jgi:hypothetical protein
MRVGEREMSILLSQDGRDVLQHAALNLADSPFLSVRVEDSDDIGMWVRVNREDGDHLVLILWEFVLSMDLQVGQPKILGVR